MTVQGITPEHILSSFIGLMLLVGIVAIGKWPKCRGRMDERANGRAGLKMTWQPVPYLANLA